MKSLHYKSPARRIRQSCLQFLEGAPTTAADDAEQIELFPKTYGAPIISFESGEAAGSKVINAGVILSGGQAPGGQCYR